MKRARGPTGNGSIAGRTELAQFGTFYNFSFLRVQRFASKRAMQMDAEVDVEALTERILVSDLTSLGGARSTVCAAIPSSSLSSSSS